jgi:hypothetical protein
MPPNPDDFDAVIDPQLLAQLEPTLPQPLPAATAPAPSDENQPQSPILPLPTATAPAPSDENQPPSSIVPEKRPIVEEISVPTKKRRQGLTESRFVNTVVTSDTGTPAILNKKPRKERSDKGKKRGPKP